MVPIHDYGDINGQFYVEMRLIDGTDLGTILKRYGPMSPARTVAIVRQIAAALDAAHALGVIHRDVKPENILITECDFAYLVDFGIARAATDSGLTQTGATVGTYHYMAPERFTTDQLTYRADIYALACVLHECLTGSRPYRTDSIERLITSHLMEPAPRASQLRPGSVPVAFDHVIATGMAKNPEERYRSAGDLAAAANDALTAPEQQQAATILEQSIRATAPVGAELAAARTDFTGSGPDPQANVPPEVVPAGPQLHDASTLVRPLPSIGSDETMIRPVSPGVGAETRNPAGWPPATTAPAQSAWTPPPAVGGGNWPSQQAIPIPVGPGGPPTFGQPPGAQEPSHRGRDRKAFFIVGAVVLLFIAAIGVTGGYIIRHFSHGSGPTTASSSPSPTSSASPTLPAGQSVLPFTGLNLRLSPGGVAVDTAGSVYVTNQGMYGRVVKLSAGSSTPSVLPFSGLYEPQGLAVDSAGALYVADFNNRVVKLAAGSNTQVELPFTGLSYPEGVAVDGAGSVYVVDRGNSRVVKLAAGSSAPTDLPFTGLKNPDGVAVDGAGNVYVTDSDNDRVLKLAAGSTTQTELPFGGLTVPWGVAVDSAGTVYVTGHDNNKVFKLVAGATAPTALPFTDLNTPLGVAIDTGGNVYVADRGNDRVLKLAAT